MTDQPAMVAEWAFCCEHATVDAYDRLSIVGMTKHYGIPKLGIAFHRLTIVVVLKERPRPGDLKMGLKIVSPSGQPASPDKTENVDFSVKLDYLVVTLKRMPLLEEGTYRISLTTNGVPLTTIDVPVFVVAPGTRRH